MSDTTVSQSIAQGNRPCNPMVQNGKRANHPQAIGAFHAHATFADYFFVKASFTATSADWSAETVTARSPGAFVFTSAVPFDAVADASA